MKKVRNLTIGGIQQKIFNLVLITVILIVAVYTAVTIYQVITLNNIVAEATPKFNAITAEDTVIGAEYNALSQEVMSSITESLDHGKTVIIILLIAVICIGTAAALLLAKQIVKPLETMTREIGSLSGSNLVFKMKDDYRTGDEIEILAESFASISQKTVDYMEEIKTVTAEKERIGTELALANRIQADMLPNIFPAFPERSEFDVYATMTPAKEVGGDFYDFFLIDEEHLAIVIADVSGKGVPAALFMMISKILVQNTAMTGKGPAEVLKMVNDQICSNNREEMFITVWLGILDLTNGKITAANAGHEYPALQRSGGKFELVKQKPNFVIGGFSGMKYREFEIQLEPGDKLFIYTDGVAEASNSDLELYGTDRMLDALNQVSDAAPKEILEAVSKSVAVFAGKEPQADDLTMLCIQYFGKE